MGKADYYKKGDWNGICQECGFKFKFSKLKRSWDGLIVCESCLDFRHPQEYVRSKADKQSVPDSSPEPEDRFI